MAIITALTRAKSYMTLPDKSETIEQRVDNAEIGATREFKRKFSGYVNAKLVPDSFNSVSVEDLGNDTVKVSASHSVIKRLSNGFELSVASGNYEGQYFVKSLDTDNDTFIIDAEYFDETITFDNEERQVYEDALGWYICAFAFESLQELKANNVLISSSQLGDGSINSFSVKSKMDYRNHLKNNAHEILKSRYYPRSL